jgi:hypothetical protein
LLALATFMVRGVAAGEREGVARPERDDRDRPERRAERPRPERRGPEGQERRGDGDREEPRARPDVDGVLRGALRGRRDAGALLDFLHETCRPELGELEQLVRERPEAAGDVARRLVAQAGEMLELRRHQPDRFQEMMAARRLETQARELAERYRRAEPGREREQVGKELLEVLDKAFAARLAQRQHQVAALQKELEQQQTALKEREKNRERIIRRYFDELTGEGEKLAW